MSKLIDWLSIIYYCLTAYMSLLTGIMAAAIWMLYELLIDMIALATGRADDLLDRTDDDL